MSAVFAPIAAAQESDEELAAEITVLIRSARAVIFDSLVRSFAVINRVNKALQCAGEGLEQRVQERTRELHEAQSELVSTARQVRMAEIASNVLHNVGNVLNSVNVSVELVSRQVRGSKAQGPDKAVQLINEHSGDPGHITTRDEKGKLLPGYLNQLVAALASEQQGIVEELAQLTKSIDHIKEIVAAQQSCVGTSSLVEPVRLTDLFEDALRTHAGALVRRQIRVIKGEYDGLPLLLLDKHRLLLILVKLISNAKQAMAGLDERFRALTLSVKLLDPHNLRIFVQDQGEGIAPDNLSRIFAHGYTTRQDGHGFGLHSCALAAMELGGSLTAHSAGAGQGATLRMWREISSPVLPVGFGRAASLQSACVARHTARLAPHIASRLLGPNREIIPRHILTLELPLQGQEATP